MSDSVQVVEKTADHLAVLIPPFHSFAYGLFLSAALALVLAVSMSLKGSEVPYAFRLVVGGLCLALLVLAFYMNTSSILVVLSRQQNAFLIEHRAFGFEMSRKSYPLGDVAGFGLYTTRSTKGNTISHDISVELKSGREFGVAGATTNQVGYDTAVDALNDFLGE
jgi:hypothetical protein